MITYLYFTFSVLITLLLFIGLIKVAEMKAMLAIPISVIFIAFTWGMYEFYFQQKFVRSFGGKMSLVIKEDEQLVNVTWKEDNMWILTFNPKTALCYFRESSRGNMLQGEVVIKNCKVIPLVE